MSIPLLGVIREWYCPRCGVTATTRETKPHSQFHHCPKMGMLATPLLPAGTRAKVEAVEREDYVGDEKVRLDANGRPVMAVTVEREDGRDTTVYAPTATADGRA